MVKSALNYAREHIQRIKDIYNRENHPLPPAFSEEDVDIRAPRLFSDNFALSILEDIAEARIKGYGTAMRISTRSDIWDFFNKSLDDPANVLEKTVRLAIAKGCYMRPPYIPVPEKMDFVGKKSFITGYLGKKRPLTAIEISHIFSGLKKNLFRKTLFLGFSRTAGHNNVRRYLEKGSEIASKHAKVFASILIENDLPVSMNRDSEIIGSQTKPYSDRLMMQYAAISNVILADNYGKALTVSGTKRDLGINYARLTIEILKYAGDGVNTTIEKGWFKEPPQAPAKPARMLH